MTGEETEIDARTEGRTDGRVARGDETRRRILRRAVDIASVEGLEGLSIGRLAKELEISKSGVFTRFGSKEELQLAAVQAAAVIYRRHVIEPALAVPPGLRRVWQLCDSWLDYSRQRVFPGGCFFFAASAEFDAQVGPVRDALAAAGRDWKRFVERTVEDARQLGELAEDTDAGQLAFELNAFLDAANATSIMHDDPVAYDRARTAIRIRLEAIVTGPLTPE
ncbi:TetR/AcrR family transcriptional regulator [Catenulispora yoronensis]|uniref:TetR/AcrR family transcriptional regulator n=1 Tax=Catenulispora yoronensis TaxID=450799 RepID=UPI0031D93C88